MTKRSANMTHIFSLASLCAIALLTVSCANTPSPRLATAPAGAPPTNVLHGKVVAADTNLPIAGATIFVPKVSPAANESKAITDLSLNSAIEQTMGCKVPTEPYSSFSCTDGFGNFTIPLVGNDWTGAELENIQLKVQYNDTTIHTELTLNDLDSDLGTILFAENNQQPQKDKIAIVLDMSAQASPMGRSADNPLPNPMGVEFQEQFVKLYDIDESQYDVEFMPFPDLFADQDSDHNVDIFKYKIVYLITAGNEDLSDLGKDKKSTLLKFISNGGELFVTTLTVEEDDPSLNEYI